MTENLERWSGKALSDGFDERAPDNVAPLVAWLASPDSSAITGRVFGVRGGRLSLLEGWRHTAEVERGAQWEAEEVGPAVRELVSRSEAPTSNVAR
jgi:hypothetical protein